MVVNARLRGFCLMGELTYIEMMREILVRCPDHMDPIVPEFDFCGINFKWK